MFAVDDPQLTVVSCLVCLHFHHSSRVRVGIFDGERKIVESTKDVDHIDGTFEDVDPIDGTYDKTSSSVRRYSLALWKTRLPAPETGMSEGVV